MNLHYALAGQPLHLHTLAMAFPTLAEWSHDTVEEVADTGRLDPTDAKLASRLVRRYPAIGSASALRLAIVEACRKEVSRRC